MYTVERLLGGSPNATLDQPLDHLVACHGRIQERLATLERAAAVLETQPAEALEAIQACFRYLETNGVRHTQDEEESTFPRLRPRLSSEELAAIERLEAQHREADDLYRQLQAAATPEEAGRFRSLLARFAGLYRSHIDFENRELIRMARNVLSGEELSEISAEMKRRRGLE